MKFIIPKGRKTPSGREEISAKRLPRGLRRDATMHSFCHSSRCSACFGASLSRLSRINRLLKCFKSTAEFGDPHK